MSVKLCMWIFIQLVITLCYQSTDSSDPLDITCATRPLASNSNDALNIYAIGSSKTTDMSIGILYNDMNGKDNVTWADTGHSDNIAYTTTSQTKDMPDGKIFDTQGSEIQYEVAVKFVRLCVHILTNYEEVGVFSFEATKNEVVTRSASVVTSLSANIIMQFRTWTVGIGESTTINLSEGATFNNLHWRHNYGDAIKMWNGNSSVTIENIRGKDDGVYECYRGDSPGGKHGIMRLIVRGCPLPKWNPPECEADCPICYNGGVCDDKTGECICPIGFTGDNCETACEPSTSGRYCGVWCLTSYDNCKRWLFCQPDPLGCTCFRGFGGNNCTTVCDGSHYGADCSQSCHCDNCDTARGCVSGSTCKDGYTGPTCQESNLPCSSGLFGALCNFPCHCKDFADCNRDGSCDNGCHEAWAGTDCSIALPYRSGPPTLVNQTATTLTIDASWVPGQDFGTGTITRWTLLYKTSQTNTFTSVSKTDNNVFTIDKLSPHTTVQFYTQHSRLVSGEEVDGPPSVHGTAENKCAKPLEEPEIELKTVEENKIILIIKPVSNAPEQIQCDDILRYQVRYRSVDGNEQDIVNTTDGSQTEVKISGLSECVVYDVDSRVVNNEEIVGDWGEYIRVQISPTALSINEDSVLGETALLMKWNATTCNTTLDHVIYHYKLVSGVIDKQGRTAETEVLIEDGIEPCTQYTFTVYRYASSQLGLHTSSDTMEVASAVAYPGIPNITSLSATGSSIDIRWSPPIDGNSCEIIQYNVSVQSCLLSFSKLTVDTFLHIDENLHPDIEYSLKVAAKTLKGYGDYSSSLSVKIKEDVLAAGCKYTGYIVAGTLTIAFLIISTLYSIFLIRKLKKRIHTITKGSQINMMADENAYKTLTSEQHDGVAFTSM